MHPTNYIVRNGNDDIHRIIRQQTKNNTKGHRTSDVISLRNHIRNEDIRKRMKKDDVMGRITQMKYRIAHVGRKHKHKHNEGRPQKRWQDDIKKRVERSWHQMAQKSNEWKWVGLFPG